MKTTQKKVYQVVAKNGLVLFEGSKKDCEINCRDNNYYSKYIAKEIREEMFPCKVVEKTEAK